MAQFAYSPYTFELIITDTIADWMGTTEIQPPEYNKETESPHFIDSAWVIKQQEPQEAMGQPTQPA